MSDPAYRWMRRTARSLPMLAQRIFALRDIAYAGCGFHYALEHDLGRAFCMFNDYVSPMTTSRMITMEVHMEELYREVKKAEVSAALIATRSHEP